MDICPSGRSTKIYLKREAVTQQVCTTHTKSGVLKILKSKYFSLEAISGRKVNNTIKDGVKFFIALGCRNVFMSLGAKIRISQPFLGKSLRIHRNFFNVSTERYVPNKFNLLLEL